MDYENDSLEEPFGIYEEQNLASLNHYPRLLPQKP
jgi:hypothetical protein